MTSGKKKRGRAMRTLPFCWVSCSVCEAFGVIRAQLDPIVPMWLRDRPAQPRFEHVDMRVPARADVEPDIEVLDPLMDDRQQHVVAALLEPEGDAAGAAPADRQ